jgi:hypothetical protein
MSDFEQRQATYWHADACRKAELIGGITSYVNAAQNTTARFPLTAEHAIDRIARLLAEYAEKGDQHRGVDQ